jgi:hypothetical protein
VIKATVNIFFSDKKANVKMFFFQWEKATVNIFFSEKSNREYADFSAKKQP